MPSIDKGRHGMLLIFTQAYCFVHDFGIFLALNLYLACSWFCLTEIRYLKILFAF